MPEQVVELQDYSYKYPKNPSEERKKIPAELRESLTNVLENFPKYITQSPERIKPPNDHTPKTFVYCHPDPAFEITYKIDEEKKFIEFISYDAPEWASKKLLFICYSRRDEQWLGELKKWLVPLVQKNIIKIWDDTQIRAGDVIKEEINKSLGAAKGAVLLISQDFLISNDICQNILPSLLEAAKAKKIKILWFPVSFCPVEEVLPDIVEYRPLYDQPLKGLSDEDRDKAFTEIFKKIKQAMEV